MARRSNGNAANYLESLARAPVTALPITMACWARPFLSQITDFGNLMCIGNNTAAGRLQLAIDGNQAGKPWIGATTTSGGTQIAFNGPNARGQWEHVAGVFLSTTSRTVYGNGIAGTTNTTANDPSAANWNRVQLGARRNNTVALPFIGDIADAAIWSVALTALEIQLLATGISPLQIRASNLVAYWPLNGRVGSGEASLISRLDYATQFGTNPIVSDPLEALRNKARSILPSFLIPSVTIPTLSSPTVINVTQTSATPRVTLTF